MVNRIWPTAVANKADNVSSVSASACHIGGPIDVNPGQWTLVYGIFGSRDITLIAGFHAKAPPLIIIFCSLIKIISNLITTTLHHNCNLSMHACQYDVAPPHITTTFQILYNLLEKLSGNA